MFGVRGASIWENKAQPHLCPWRSFMSSCRRWCFLLCFWATVVLLRDVPLHAGFRWCCSLVSPLSLSVLWRCFSALSWCFSILSCGASIFVRCGVCFMALWGAFICGGLVDNSHSGKCFLHFLRIRFVCRCVASFLLSDTLALLEKAHHSRKLVVAHVVGGAF